MSDFSKYQGWIKELTPLLGTPEFDTAFKQLTSSLARAEAFQLKMEIKRLGKPCFKTIDLRGKVDGKCEPVEIDGRTHYLDDVAKSLMSELLIAYGGKITEAVYAAMQNTHNNFRVIRQREEEHNKKAALQTLGIKTDETDAVSKSTRANTVNKLARKNVARFLPFLEYHSRDEERMLYVTHIEIKNGAQNNQASTLNISPSGLRIKLTSKASLFSVNETVSVNFLQLSEEFAFKHHDKIEFKVVSETVGEKNERIYGLLLQPKPEYAEYRQVVINLIKGNKLRYKLDTTNVEDALLQRAYEFQTTATTSMLPVFYHQQGNRLELQYTLLNSKTESTIDFFNISGKSQLEGVFSHKRLAPLLNEPGKIKECVLFSFKHVSESGTRLFAAFDFELDKQLKDKFFYYGRNQSDFRQFIVRIVDADGPKHNISSVLPDEISKEVRLRNAPLSPRVEKRLTPINGLLSIIDVSDDEWDMWGKTSRDFNQLLRFKVEPVTAPQLEVVPREFLDKRLEPRFQMKTKALVNTKGQSTSAITVDFSTKGLRLLCSDTLKVAKKDQIYVELTQFQSMTKVFKLNTLPYEVIDTTRDGKQLHLKRIPNGKGQHIGSLFFRQLIRANADKLKTSDTATVQELSTGLTNLLIRSQMQAVSFLELDKENKWGVSTLMTNNLAHPLLDYCPTEEVEHIGTCVDMSKLVNVSRISLIQDKIKRRSNKNYVDLIIAMASASELIVKHDEAFNDQQTLREYIKNLQKSNYRIIVLRIQISSVIRYNPEQFKLELRYLRQYAPHKADLILKQISGIKGVCHIFEVTNAFLMRLKLASAA